jgi:hypothetical protein
MVGHQIDHDPDADGVQRLHKKIEVLQGAESRIDVPIVRDVVAAISPAGWVERAEPHRVYAELGQVVDAADDPTQIPYAVRIGVGEAPRIDLVDDGLLPPGPA